MTLKRRELLQLCVVAAAAVVVSLLLRTSRPLGQDVAHNSLARAIREDRSSPSVAPPAADLTLVVFTDYRCPACRKAHPAMHRAVARDGRLRIVYKDWPIFGDRSKRAAVTALASTFQNIYPRLHDRLMTGPAETDEDLKLAVEQSGGDWGRLQNDLTLRRTQIEAQLRQNTRQAFELGLPGTPGYLVGPILVRGAMTEREFLRVFEKARQAS